MTTQRPTTPRHPLDRAVEVGLVRRVAHGRWVSKHVVTVYITLGGDKVAGFVHACVGLPPDKRDADTLTHMHKHMAVWLDGRPGDMVGEACAAHIARHISQVEQAAFCQMILYKAFAAALHNDKKLGL